jgi:hypothetical protein
VRFWSTWFVLGNGVFCLIFLHDLCHTIHITDGLNCAMDFLYIRQNIFSKKVNKMGKSSQLWIGDGYQQGVDI